MALQHALRRIAFERARGHIQLKIVRLEDAPPKPKELPIGGVVDGEGREHEEPAELVENRDQLLVHGVVCRVFRGESVWLNEPATVLAWIVRPDDPYAQSRSFWLPLVDVKVGRVLEAWVEGEPALFHVAGLQAKVIDFDVATDAPALPISEADTKPPAPPKRDRLVAVILAIVGAVGFAIAYASLSLSLSRCGSFS